jgi:hypothetical protein
MSKLYRSLLWSGLVVAGVAACGDDVTVQPPPPPPAATVHSVSVAPTGITIGVNGTVQMVASVNADAGIATTVTWSSGATAVATVSATGLVTGQSNGPVAITACSTVVTTVCGSASLTVSSSAATVTGVTVTPANAPLFVGQTLTASASVQGANNPAQTVTWTSLATSVATVGAATGVITGVANGTAVITACSTLAGFTNVCGSMSVTVSTPSPASVQLLNVTWVPTITLDDGEGNLTPTCVQGPGPSVPVILTNTRCQIEVTSQVNSGDQTLSRLDIVFTQGGVSTVLASQSFSAGPSAEFAPISADITLSMNTTQVRRVNGILVPVVFNGNAAISAQLFVVGTSTPIATPAIPVVMNNEDAIVALSTQSPQTIPAMALAADAVVAPAPVTDDAGNVWFAGSSTFTGPQYISFSTKVPTSVTWEGDLCGTSSSTVTGTALTGISLSGGFDCAGVEGQNTVTGFNTPTYAPPLNGPDGTPIGIPQFLSNVGGGFTVGGELRWNLITPAVPATVFPSLFIDNAAPVVTLPTIAYNPAYDQSWINATFDIGAAVSATDGGPIVGLTSIQSTSASLFGGVTCSTTPLPNPHGLAETLTSTGFDSYRVCGLATDWLGNVGTSAPSNTFGVDTGIPLARLIGSTTATPSIAPNNTPTVSAVHNTTIYALAAEINNQVWGLEGFDNRSGFNQAVVAGSDAATQTLVRTLFTGITSFTLDDGLTQVLSDNWIRSTNVSFIDNGLGVGYYDYTGNVNDRAGNFSADIIRNFAEDLAAPATSFMAPAQASYAGGTAAAFNIFANDDLEVLNSYLAFAFPTLGPPAAGIIYPYKSFASLSIGQPWPDFPPISALVPSAGVTGTISIPYFLARIDESCTSSGVPYTSCGPALGSKPTVASDYNTDLNLNAPTTDAGKAPTGALTNVQDIAGRDGITGAAFSFNVSVPVVAQSEQFSTPTFDVNGDVTTWTGNPPSVGGCPAGEYCADQKTATSSGLRYFQTVSLWRLNTSTNQWTYCADMAAQALPFVDNGVFRIWRSTVAIPASSNPCTALTGFWRVMGTKNGAGLFSPSF